MLNIATAARGWFGSKEGQGGPPQTQMRPVTSPAVHRLPLSSQTQVEKGAMTEPEQGAEFEAMLGQAELTAREAARGLPEVYPETAFHSPSEASLIGRAQNGDQLAFGELVEMHQDFVYNLAYRILQNEEEADDATQEAFVKIWQALPGFRGDSKFTTWAYRIIRNLCLNRLRSTKNNPRLVSVETNFDEGEEEGREIVSNLPGAETEEPAWHFDSSERRQLIWQQVDGLPVKYREIIGLYYQQELSYEEISAALDVPVGTVKTHLFRAKAMLKNKLLELNSRGMLDFGY